MKKLILLFAILASVACEPETIIEERIVYQEDVSRINQLNEIIRNLQSDLDRSNLSLEELQADFIISQNLVQELSEENLYLTDQLDRSIVISNIITKRALISDPSIVLFDDDWTSRVQYNTGEVFGIDVIYVNIFLHKPNNPNYIVITTVSDENDEVRFAHGDMEAVQVWNADENRFIDFFATSLIAKNLDVAVNYFETLN